MMSLPKPSRYVHARSFYNECKSENDNLTSINTTCCVVGGGPAGMMTGLLLARAGIETLVIEKHADFFRDFRGDTVHPSTMELMEELGLLKAFLKIPHQEVTMLGGEIGDDVIALADFSHLSTVCKFIALMPQWDFLDFLAAQARSYKTFSLKMNTEATGIIENNGRITGVKAKAAEGEIQINSQLVIACDGRTSIIRQAAGLSVRDIGAPMDVLWMRLSRLESDPGRILGRLKPGAMFVMLDRGEYWQCGFIIKKGQFDDLKAEGIEAFRQRIKTIVPFMADRLGELKSWDDVKLLVVKVDRLEEWHRDGLVCIGDAAHAMSPVGGVGINLAIQDAVAAANILWKPLSEGRCERSDLARLQKRRSYPTRMTQTMQVLIQNQVIGRTLSSGEVKAPVVAKAFNLIPLLRQIPANIIGIGFRPEHIESPKIRQPVFP